MRLPEHVFTAAAWRLHDFQQSYLTSKPATAAGLCRVELPTVPQDEVWLIDRMVVSTDSTTDTVAFFYLDAVDPTRGIDGTWWGNFDVADYASPIQLPGGVTLLCEWTGASVGTVGTLRVQYQLLRRQD